LICVVLNIKSMSFLGCGQFCSFSAQVLYSALVLMENGF